MTQDVIRALIDALGAIACSGVDAVPSSRASSTTVSMVAAVEEGGRGGEGSGGEDGAFMFAVHELCSMCGGEKVEQGDWALLGLPLRF